MTGRLTEFVRGANGGVEVNRLIGFVGGLGVILGALGFQAWDMHRGADFDVSDFCLSLAGAVSILTGGTGIAVAIKDRQVAMAKVISETNTVPTKPPAGPKPPVDDPDGKPAPRARASRSRSPK